MPPRTSPNCGPFTVTLIRSAAPHQKHLADVLLREGVLRRLVRFAPDFEILEPDGAGDLKSLRRFSYHRVASRILWGIWRRLPVLNRRAPLPVIALSWVSSRVVSGWIPPSDIFHGLAGIGSANLQRARQLGAVTLLDIGTLHPSAWQREIFADSASAGLRPQHCEGFRTAMEIRRHEREFELCDKIVVYSSAAWRSFQEFPYGHKAVVVRPGIDHQLFAPLPPGRRGRSFRVCYVGRIEAAKGVHFLTQAWKRLALPDAELVLVGRVLPEMAGLQSEGPSARIRLAGILTHEGVARLYQESDLFVFPSVNEGLSLALLEAMSTGLPAIASSDTGAQDCITPGKSGLLVPGRNRDALADAILWCYRHRDELAAMGPAARITVEENFTLSHYARRMMELYKSITKP